MIYIIDEFVLLIVQTHLDLQNTSRFKAINFATFIVALEITVFGLESFSRRLLIKINTEFTDSIDNNFLRV